MGINQSKLEDYCHNFQRNNWTQINEKQTVRENGEIGKVIILQNNLTGQEIEEYQLQFNQQTDYNQYVTCFLWRREEQNIVNTLFLQNQTLRQMCATHYRCKLFTQRIPSRLSDITDIPFPENLYIVNACLLGFQKLFSNVGYFKIQQEFICINKNGQIKVWFNSDLSRNFPESDQLFDNQLGSLQNVMIREIIELINENTDKDTEPQQSFIDFYADRDLTFEEAFYIVEQYAKKLNTQIPEYFQSIVQILNEKYAQQKQQQKQQSDLNSGHNNESQTSQHMIYTRNNNTHIQPNNNKVQNNMDKQSNNDYIVIPLSSAENIYNVDKLRFSKVSSQQRNSISNNQQNIQNNIVYQDNSKSVLSNSHGSNFRNSQNNQNVSENFYMKGTGSSFHAPQSQHTNSQHNNTIVINNNQHQQNWFTKKHIPKITFTYSNSHNTANSNLYSSICNTNSINYYNRKPILQQNIEETSRKMNESMCSMNSFVQYRQPQVIKKSHFHNNKRQSQNSEIEEFIEYHQPQMKQKKSSMLQQKFDEINSNTDDYCTQIQQSGYSRNHQIEQHEPYEVISEQSIKQYNLDPEILQDLYRYNFSIV